MRNSRKHRILWGCDHDGDRHRLVVLEGAWAMPIEYDSLYFLAGANSGFGIERSRLEVRIGLELNLLSMSYQL